MSWTPKFTFFVQQAGTPKCKGPFEERGFAPKRRILEVFGLHGYVRLLREKRKGGLPLPLL